MKSSVFKHADPSNLGRSPPEGNKDHLLSQARSDLMKQEHQAGSLNHCISDLQQQAYAQRLELQDAQHGYVESRREEVRSQEELPLQKLRENHETIQKLTSQLQEMQDQMNSVNESGEFQEVESNNSGRLSYVCSQPAMIPSARSMLSRDKRLPLDTWNASGLQENVFGNQFSTFDSPRDHPQGIHSCATQRERGSVTQTTGTGTVFTRDDKK